MPQENIFPPQYPYAGVGAKVKSSAKIFPRTPYNLNPDQLSHMLNDCYVTFGWRGLTYTEFLYKYYDVANEVESLFGTAMEITNIYEYARAYPYGYIGSSDYLIPIMFQGTNSLGQKEFRIQDFDNLEIDEFQLVRGNSDSNAWYRTMWQVPKWYRRTPVSLIASSVTVGAKAIEWPVDNTAFYWDKDTIGVRCANNIVNGNINIGNYNPNNTYTYSTVPVFFSSYNARHQLPVEIDGTFQQCRDKPTQHTESFPYSYVYRHDEKDGELLREQCRPQGWDGEISYLGHSYIQSWKWLPETLDWVFVGVYEAGNYVPYGGALIGGACYFIFYGDISNTTTYSESSCKGAGCECPMAMVTPTDLIPIYGPCMVPMECMPGCGFEFYNNNTGETTIYPPTACTSKDYSKTSKQYWDKIISSNGFLAYLMGQTVIETNGSTISGAGVGNCNYYYRSFYTNDPCYCVEQVFPFPTVTCGSYERNYLSENGYTLETYAYWNTLPISLLQSFYGNSTYRKYFSGTRTIEYPYGCTCRFERFYFEENGDATDTREIEYKFGLKITDITYGDYDVAQLRGCSCAGHHVCVYDCFGGYKKEGYQGWYVNRSNGGGFFASIIGTDYYDIKNGSIGVGLGSDTFSLPCGGNSTNIDNSRYCTICTTNWLVYTDYGSKFHLPPESAVILLNKKIEEYAKAREYNLPYLVIGCLQECSINYGGYFAGKHYWSVGYEWYEPGHMWKTGITVLIDNLGNEVTKTFWSTHIQPNMLST